MSMSHSWGPWGWYSESSWFWKRCDWIPVEMAPGCCADICLSVRVMAPGPSDPTFCGEKIFSLGPWDWEQRSGSGRSLIVYISRGFQEMENVLATYSLNRPNLTLNLDMNSFSSGSICPASKNREVNRLSSVRTEQWMRGKSWEGRQYWVTALPLLCWDLVVVISGDGIS